MKNRYDGSPSKEAAMANVRQNRLQTEHMQKDEFVKKVQREQMVHAGKEPRMRPELMDFCSYMSNDGEHAQELAREITHGLDKVAFPVK